MDPPSFDLDLPLMVAVPFTMKLEVLVITTLVEGKIDEIDDGPFIDARLNQWIPLPGWGDNSVLVKRRTGHHRPLVMFPRLDQLGLELWFRSRWCGETFEVEDVDIILPCKQDQLWPYCAWCRKFHLPSGGDGSHRATLRS